jgi:hypothetical protein
VVIGGISGSLVVNIVLNSSKTPKIIKTAYLDQIYANFEVFQHFFCHFLVKEILESQHSQKYLQIDI